MNELLERLISGNCTALIFEIGDYGFIQLRATVTGAFVEWPITKEKPKSEAERCMDVMVDEFGYEEVEPQDQPQVGKSPTITQDTSDGILRISVPGAGPNTVYTYDPSHLSAKQVVLASDGCYAQLGSDKQHIQDVFGKLAVAALGAPKGQMDVNVRII